MSVQETHPLLKDDISAKFRDGGTPGSHDKEGSEFSLPLANHPFIRSSASPAIRRSTFLNVGTPVRRDFGNLLALATTQALSMNC